VIDWLLVRRISARLRHMGALEWAMRLCIARGVPFEEVLGIPSARSRHSDLVIRVRHEMWCVVQDTFGLSSVKAGNVFEVDHTSILYARKKHFQLAA